MHTLTDTQRVILQAAAHHPDGLAAAPNHLPPAPRGAVARRLLDAGLLEPAGAAGPDQQAMAWKLDGASVLLRITEAGRRAISTLTGTAPEDAQGAPPEAPDATGPCDARGAAEAAQGAPTGQHAAASNEAATGTADTALVEPQGGAPAAQGPEAYAAAPTASTTPLARATSLRDAARQVLAAWDDEAGHRTGLAEAIDTLRAALPQARQPRLPATPRTPRQGTKQQAVLALLRRPEGASGPDIIAATGWEPHTVRGFLAGLKKRGMEVLVHDRVRQVGPGKDGAKGSYTIYRIAEAAAG